MVLSVHCYVRLSPAGVICFFLSVRHKDKPLAPIDLQRYAIDYRVTDLALKLKSPQSGKPAAFEFAAAAFDADSRMLNGHCE